MLSEIDLGQKHKTGEGEQWKENQKRGDKL
jgi:hypothetical protein